ncbi:hypothetical protein [Streptomyces sp. A0592]|uniref:hypothetical protein n=1 Tax=Streptomyces sp. A0592 TaxID=2563099 RepID=UPI001F0D381A|nr:hypothetical protein [Streptomyces sp. A0592]
MLGASETAAGGGADFEVDVPEAGGLDGTRGEGRLPQFVVGEAPGKPVVPSPQRSVSQSVSEDGACGQRWCVPDIRPG